MARKKNPIKEVLLSLWILVGGIYLIVWWFFFSGAVLATSRTDAPSRNALTAMHRDIALGSNFQAVLQAFYRHRTTETNIVVLKPQLLRVNTPLEFGAENWVLLVELSEDKVVGVRMRTSDFASPSPEVPPPPGSPPDKNGQSASRATVKHQGQRH
jgi:hypothetical protein